VAGNDYSATVRASAVSVSALGGIHKIQQLAQDIVSHLHATHVHGKMRGRCCVRDVWRVSAVAVTT